MQWHIVGAGATGCLWAARLAQAAERRKSLVAPPILVMRPTTWKALRSPAMANVLVKELPRRESEHAIAKAGQGGEEFAMSVPVEPTSATLPIRHALVAVKAPHAAEALASIAHRLNDDSLVLLMCNGMGVYEEVVSNHSLARFRYMLGTTTHGAYTQPSPFSIIHAGHGHTWIGAAHGRGPSPERARAAADALAASDLDVSLEPRIRAALWRKLAANAALNGLTALLECPNGVVLDDAGGCRVVATLCAEAAAVMAADLEPDEARGGNDPGGDGTDDGSSRGGCGSGGNSGSSGSGGAKGGENFFSAPSAEGLTAFALDVAMRNRHNFSSMYQDIVVRRRPSEVNYINGYIVRRAEALGLPAPVNRTVWDLVKMKEAIRCGS